MPNESKEDFVFFDAKANFVPETEATKRTVFIEDKKDESTEINQNEQVLPLKRSYESNGHLNDEKDTSHKKFKDVSL